MSCGGLFESLNKMAQDHGWSKDGAESMNAFDKLIKAYINEMGIHDLLDLHDYVTRRIRLTVKAAEETGKP